MVCIWFYGFWVLFVMRVFFYFCSYLSLCMIESLNFFGCVEYLFWTIHPYWKMIGWWLDWWLRQVDLLASQCHSDEISVYCGENDSSIRTHLDPLGCFDPWFMCWDQFWRACRMMRSLSLEPNVDVAFERLIIHVWSVAQITYSV